MKKITLLSVLFFTVVSLAAQKPSLTVKAFERYHISGLPPTPVIEIGGKETVTTRPPSGPEYFIYLIASQMPLVKMESVWIKKDLYKASITKVTCKPVILNNGIQNDTLVRYTDEEVWQINLTGKIKKYSKPAKSISALVSGNELVLRLQDKKGNYYTRSVKYISKLESTRGQ